MSNLNIQRCPETGICSIIREDGSKIDLMPDEVVSLTEATDVAKAKEILSEVDASFAAALGEDELTRITREVK